MRETLVFSSQIGQEKALKVQEASITAWLETHAGAFQTLPGGHSGGFTMDSVGLALGVWEGFG